MTSELRPEEGKVIGSGLDEWEFKSGNGSNELGKGRS